METKILKPRIVGSRKPVVILIKNIEFMEKRQVIDNLDIESQLNKIAKLEKGWFNGKGSAFNSDKLKLLSEKFKQNFSSKIALPYLYPTPDDSIQAEWTFKEYEVSLEIEISSFNAYYHQLNLNTNEDEDDELDLNKDYEWKRLNSKLRIFI